MPVPRSIGRVPTHVVLKAVVGTHSRPEDVTGMQHQQLTVDQRVNLSFDEDVGLLERVVVWMGDGRGLVIDHEHGVELGAALLVDQHLHTDAAVRQECGGHAGRHGGSAHVGATREFAKVHRIRIEAHGVLVSGVTHVGHHGGRFDECLVGDDERRCTSAGWPSFSKPLRTENVAEVTDRNFGMRRTEVRSARGTSDLGHVLADGSASEGGLRYCINSVALRFVPYGESAVEGHGEFTGLFKGSATEGTAQWQR